MTGSRETLRICFVRHAQTERNQEKRLQGRSDESLSARGREEAERTGRALRNMGMTWDLVLSSPLKRAMETAEILCPGAVIGCDERLLEMDYGPYEGVSLLDPPPEIIRFFSDFVHEPAPPGMESLESVCRRMEAFLEDIRALRDTDSLLVVTHAIALKGALEVLTPISRGSWWGRHIGNCAVFRTELRQGLFTEPEIIFSPGMESGP